MNNIYCPNCKKLLFKASLAHLETVCNGCKRLITVNFISRKGLMESSLVKQVIYAKRKKEDK